MRTAFDEIMAVRGKGAPLADEVSIVNQDPVLESRFRLGETCAAALAGVGVAVNDIWELKTSQRQHIGIDVRHAAAALKSSLYLQRPDSSGTFRNVVNAGHQAMLNITATVGDTGRSIRSDSLRIAPSAAAHARAARMRPNP